MSINTLSSCEELFIIPELAGCVARYLHVESLGRLSLASKSMMASAAPYLWRSYILDRDIDEEPSPGLAYNLKHVRAIGFQTVRTGILDVLAAQEEGTLVSTEDKFGRRYQSAQTLTRLLYMGGMEVEAAKSVGDEQLDQLLSILQRNEYLHAISLPGECLGRVGPLSFIMARLPNLTSVTIMSGWDIQDVGSAFQLLELSLSLPNLQVLRCPCRVEIQQQMPSLEIMFSQTVETIRSHRAYGRFPLGLRELELPQFASQYPETFLSPFFGLGFQSLETLHVPSLSAGALDTLEGVFLENCSRVRNIRMNGLEHRRIALETLGLVARSCCSQLGCRSLEVSSMEWSIFHQDAIALHRATLESLVIRFPFFMTSDHVQAILATCPALKEFKLDGEGSGFTLNMARFPQYKEIAGDDRGVNNVEDLAIKNWACTKLKTLSLTSGNPRVYSQAPNKGFYSQLGRLTELEELTFGYSQFRDNESQFMDFTLLSGKAGGRLETLKGLKKLRVLHLRGQMMNQLGQAEIEFMEREWPDLERVVFGSWVKVQPQAKDTDHWKWFMARRPWLTVRNDRIF